MSSLSLNENVEFMMKIILIGDSGVGKSNLLLRYCRDEFNLNSKATIGTDFYSKDVCQDDVNVKVQFWDTAGQEKFRSMTSQYYKECHGIILVYDVTNKQSFENCQNWINDVREHNKSDIELLLLANKIDLADKREVKLEDGEKFAMLNKMKFLEVSALTNYDQCVNKGFLMIIKEITEKLIQSRNMKDKSEPSQKKQIVDLEKKKSCCQ